MTTDELGASQREQRRLTMILPVGLLVLVLLPLLLMPLAAIFVFAFRGGFTSFLNALSSPDAQFATI